MTSPSLDRATIFALSSGQPPAAIAVIRISGDNAHRSAEALCGELPEPRRAAVRALRHPDSSELLDEALVLRFDGPHSATGEDLVEFHCHGGKAVAAAVLEALGRLAGARAAEPGEFTRRAFENGRIDLTEAEGLADLLEAETEAQRRSALALAEGGLRRLVEDWRQRLLTLSAEAELEIDYVGEGENRNVDIATGAAALESEIGEWLARPRVEPLRNGVRVVIAGPPNAGKSSLLNALVGHDRSIVAAEEGTTRDHVDVPLAIDGIPVLLTDTAGLRSTPDAVERQGIDRARALIEQSDLLLWLGPIEDSPSHPRLLPIRAKADLAAEDGADRAAYPVSARTGAGVAGLLSRIGQTARQLLPSDGAIALNGRQSDALTEAAQGLRQAQIDDVVVAADGLRRAREAFDRVTGRAGIEDFLDSLFGRFCLGK